MLQMYNNFVKGAILIIILLCSIYILGLVPDQLSFDDFVYVSSILSSVS